MGNIAAEDVWVEIKGEENTRSDDDDGLADG